MNKKMSFIPSFFKALALVVCLMWNFLSHAGPLNTPIFSVSFSPTTIGPGSVSTMTYTIDNSAQATGVSGLTFTNTLPAGMTIASPAVALNTCLNGSYVSTPGSSVTSFSDYRLGAGASCSFQVDVTSTTAGAHINTTGALSTSAGSADTSSDTLTVDDNRPGFSMAFSPATITPGAISTLTYTIDNSANSSNATFLSFTHSLPTGLIFSQQPNITNSCSATVVAEPSSSTLTSARAAVSAGATCTISVDVTAPSAGVYQTKSIGLSRFGSNPSGQGSAELTVGSSFMFMTFPNASAPGTTVDLTYTINNVDRVNAAENISFTNDLNATLSGLIATALPSDGFCGAGSSLTIPSPITVTGANLSAGASCTFKISVLIPASAAAGSYTNTTSVINLTLGSATTKAAATNTLAIKKAPQVSMSFLNNTVNSGENLTLRYVVTNTDTTNSATNLGFTMPINSVVSGMVTNTLPTANTCGVGSTFSETDDGSTRYFKFADGTIPAGGSCTFDLVLTLPADNSSANYLLTTSTIAGTVNGDTVYGNQARETLAVMSAAKLSLAIVEEQIVPGGQVTLEFTLDYSESAAADVSNLAFTVDLNTVLSGLTAVSTPSGDVCGAGSTISGSSILTFSSGSLSSASQCSFSVTLSVPNNATPSIITLTSSAVTGSTGGQAVNSAAASDTLVISALHLTKSFSPDVVLAGDIISLTYTLTNSSADATLISFTDSMSSVINSFQAITLPTDPCGVGSSIIGTTSLTFAGGNLDSGASCTFIVDLQVPAGAADGVYNSVTSNVNGTVNGSNTYSVAATATLEVQSLTALLTSTAGNPTAISPILVNINFSRDVVNFTVNDLVVNNATLANFSGSGKSYQVDLIPLSNGEVTVDLPANSVDDLVDNSVKTPSSNQLTLEYNNNSSLSVLVPAANIQVQGSSFNISGTSPTEGMVIYLYSDNNNDGVVDNNTALASASVNGGSWALDATVTLGNANNFLLGNETTRAIEVIDIPTITEVTNFAPVISGSPSNVAVEDSVYTFTPTVTDTNSSDTQTFIITNKPNWATFSTTTGALTGTPTNADVGSTSGIVISVADSANASDSLAAFNLTVTNTNDAPVAQDDNIVLTYSESGRYNLDVLNNDSDVDGDVLSIINASSAIGNASIEAGELIFQIQGVFEGEIKLQYAISDGNAVIDNDNSKANVTLVFDNHIDALLPVITLPQDIEINATALFTKVDLGVATAINSEGASVPVSLVDGVTRFAPGNNLVYWQAQDSDGFKRVVTQRVTVQPLVNIAVDSQGTEGDHYKVAVHLNGESPTYPVIVPYSVSGDSDSNDHDLVLGELIIDSGLLGYIEFDTFSDGVVEADEVVIITLDDSVNVGAKSVFTLTITEDNLAPQASITVSQNNEQRTLIDKTLGEVVITSDVFDANNDDNHSYTWISVGGVLVDSDSEDTSFTFDPTNVATGQQKLSLNVTDNGESPLSTVVFVYLDIVEALPTLTDIDSDGDLIPDNAEGYGDTDNDGIADYLDNNNSRCNIQTSEISEQELYLIETESSICLRRGINTANNQSGALLLSVDEVINDNEAINVGGVFDFILSGLPIAGQSISLVLPQRLPIPENAIYRKLTSDNGWGEFAVDTNNYYSSAAGEIGYCPAPNDDSWTLGLTAGHWCVQLTIEDGGLNDDDGIANSRIVDPSGVAVFNNNNTLPEIMSEQVVTTQNKSVTIDVLANDIDSDGDSLSITSANVDFGNVTIVGQQLYYQPDANFFGLATIVYGVSDSNNGIGFGDVAVNVIENTAPATVDDSATTDDRTAITIDVLANDTDVDNDELTLLSVSAEQGSIIISNNMLVYTPLAGFDDVDTVTYHIGDNNGGESQGQVTVTVNAYETIIITNKSSGGSFGPIILLLGSVMLFIRRKSTLVMSKTATGKSLVQCFSLLGLLSLSFSSYAAQAPKFDIFIKAELGQGKAKTSGISKQVPVGVVTQIDNKATSWSIGVGANITKDWSVTLSYVDMGEGSLAITGDTLIASKYHQSVAKIVPVLVKGIGFNGHYHFLQSEEYNASILFGALTWDSDVVSSYEDQRIDHDNHGIDMYYGIEGTYKIDEVWGVNAGIKRYALDVNDVDIAYLGLTYDF